MDVATTCPQRPDSLPHVGPMVPDYTGCLDLFGLRNYSVQNKWYIMDLFIKFGRMTSFIILVLTKYEECVDDGSTHSIPQTKQKSEECENDRLPRFSNQKPYKCLDTTPTGHLVPMVCSNHHHRHEEEKGATVVSPWRRRIAASSILAMLMTKPWRSTRVVSSLY